MKINQIIKNQYNYSKNTFKKWEYIKCLTTLMNWH